MSRSICISHWRCTLAKDAHQHEMSYEVHKCIKHMHDLLVVSANVFVSLQAWWRCYRRVRCRQPTGTGNGALASGLSKRRRVKPEQRLAATPRLALLPHLKRMSKPFSGRTVPNALQDLMEIGLGAISSCWLRLAVHGVSHADRSPLHPHVMQMAVSQLIAQWTSGPRSSQDRNSVAEAGCTIIMS